MRTQALTTLKKVWFPLGLLALLVAAGLFYLKSTSGTPFVSYTIDPRQRPLHLYSRDEQGQRFGSIERLRAWLAQRHQTLVFAMNGGMYAPGGSPKGLFIEQGRTVVPLDTTHGPGNFYLQPNGVFYLTTGRQPGICPTAQFASADTVAFATQSGPLLVLNGSINPHCTKGSANVAVRNGVGVLPDGRVVFAVSAQKVNFYDFAAFFQHLGCQQALYLDGYVSRLYLPEKGWQQTDGDFGVIVGVTVPAGR